MWKMGRLSEISRGMTRYLGGFLSLLVILCLSFTATHAALFDPKSVNDNRDQLIEHAQALIGDISHILPPSFVCSQQERRAFYEQYAEAAHRLAQLKTSFGTTKYGARETMKTRAGQSAWQGEGTTPDDDLYWQPVQDEIDAATQALHHVREELSRMKVEDCSPPQLQPVTGPFPPPHPPAEPPPAVNPLSGLVRPPIPDLAPPKPPRFCTEAERQQWIDTVLHAYLGRLISIAQDWTNYSGDVSELQGNLVRSHNLANLGVVERELKFAIAEHKAIDDAYWAARRAKWPIVDCGQPEHSSNPYQGFTGPFAGVQFWGSSNHVITNEFNADSDVRTNHFNDSGTAIGVGINAGYNWQPWGTSFVLGPVVDANILNDQVKHSFPGGASISSTVNFTASAQLRAGVLVMPDLLVFAQTGPSIANQSLKIDFGGPRTDTSKITPGWAIGGGAEWKLPAIILRAFGTPSLFVSYEHSFWNNAKLKMPVASPGFNYSWKRDSDAIKLGIRIRFGT
jgi:hypothetical protein